MCFIAVITITIVTTVAIQLLLFKFFTDGIMKELEENAKIMDEKISIIQKELKNNTNELPAQSS
ncbi:MAG: hypothetical protein Q6A85_13975 [Enterococcus mundtii]|nr:hypothetical protein [Enterococcus mundtii]